MLALSRIDTEQAEGASVEPVRTVFSIPIDQIAMGDRLRPVDEAWAEQLAQIIAVEGQRTPIDVCLHPLGTGYLLIAGGHRLRALQLLQNQDGQQRSIDAIVIDGDASDRRMVEISENLWRRGLDPLDRAAFVAGLVDVIRARQGIPADADGRVASVKSRWQKEIAAEGADTSATIALVYGWTEEVAERLGLSARTVKYDLMLHRRLVPSEVERLRRRDPHHPVLRNAAELKALAALDPIEQSKVVSLLLFADARIKGAPFARVGEAVAALRGRVKPTAEAKRFSTIIATLGRMSRREKAALFASSEFYAQCPTDVQRALNQVMGAVDDA